jgi:protein PhnA
MDNKCKLCNSNKDLISYKVEPRDEEIIICSICNTQLNDDSKIDEIHWHCLNNSMWSEIEAVKVVVFRMLTKLKKQDMLDMIYLEDDILKWANEGLISKNEDKIRKDTNGNLLQVGDTVTLVKDLDVKGANFTAKRGTIVKNIRIGNVDNHIEGKINGTTIYLKCDFIKK